MTIDGGRVFQKMSASYGGGGLVVDNKIVKHSYSAKLSAFSLVLWLSLEKNESEFEKRILCTSS